MDVEGLVERAVAGIMVTEIHTLLKKRKTKWIHLLKTYFSLRVYRDSLLSLWVSLELAVSKKEMSMLNFYLERKLHDCL